MENGAGVEGTPRFSGSSELRARSEPPTSRRGTDSRPFRSCRWQSGGLSDDSWGRVRHRSGEGPIPSGSHDTWSHRVEGIGRRMLTRKNRNNKKKDELQHPEDSSSDGNPFKRDRPHTRGRANSAFSSEGRDRKNGLCRCGAHRGRWGSVHEGRLHVKERGRPCQVKRLQSEWGKWG